MAGNLNDGQVVLFEKFQGINVERSARGWDIPLLAVSDYLIELLYTKLDVLPDFPVG